MKMKHYRKKNLVMINFGPKIQYDKKRQNEMLY